jgi:hypothetical protein
MDQQVLSVQRKKKKQIWPKNQEQLRHPAHLALKANDKEKRPLRIGLT